MKKIFFLITIFVTCYFFYKVFNESSNNETTKPVHEKLTSTKNNISIYIEQNDKIVHPKKGRVLLEKDEFNIVYKTSKPTIFMNTFSDDDTIFSLVKHKTPFKEIYPFNGNGTGMAEYRIPQEKITLTNQGMAYWYFDSESDNRFHYVKKTKDGFILKRFVKTFSYRAQDGKSSEKILIQKVNQPIYMTCLTFDKTDEKYENELKRNYFLIDWK